MHCFEFFLEFDVCSSPVWGKLQIKFPVRTKETEAIMVLPFNDHDKRLPYLKRHKVSQQHDMPGINAHSMVLHSVHNFIDNGHTALKKTTNPKQQRKIKIYLMWWLAG